jgi:hypothetical protein
MPYSQSIRIYHHEWRMKMPVVGTHVMLLKKPTWSTGGPHVKRLVQWEVVL